MHLRGPMNVSQLAVYQMPNEAFKMRKRNTVPFYNRRRALKQRDFDTTEVFLPNNTYKTRHADNRKWSTSTIRTSLSTVTSTVFTTDCEPSILAATSKPLPDTTYIGPPLPCLCTPDTRPATTNDTSPINSLNPNCTCQRSTLLTKELKRQLEATVTHSPTQSSAPIKAKTKIRKRAAAWERIAYYSSAAPAQATGLSFLANLGDPQQSGTFD